MKSYGSELTGKGHELARHHRASQLGCVPLSLIAAGCQLADTQKEDRKTMNGRALNPEQQAMVEVWERHMAAEFKEKSIDATMATMTSDPFVNHVPVMTGGLGSSEVRHFYGTYFIPGHPPDTEVVPVARTVGDDRIVDELIYKFTHTIEMPWILPDTPPTSKRVEVAIVVVVEFKDGKIAGERIYWDQASVLVQIGLIDAGKLPAAGIEASRKVADPAQEPSNRLIKRMSR
jgi:carboxymethylenebutenolidase